MAHNTHSHGPVDDPNFVNDKPYETRDFFVFGSVLKWIFSLFVFVGIASAITLVIYNIMVPRSAERSSAFPLPQVRALPPDPRLQANPMLDIRTLREQESAALTTYGRDPKTGNVHIPIDKAIDIVAQEGLPTRPDPGKPDKAEPNEPSATEGTAPAGQSATAAPYGAANNAGTPANAESGTGTESTPSGASGVQSLQPPPGANSNGSGQAAPAGGSHGGM